MGEIECFPFPLRCSSPSTASVGTSWLDFKRLCRLKKSRERRSRIAGSSIIVFCAVQQRSLNPPKTRSGKQVRQNNPPSSSSYIISKSNIYLFPPLLAAACQKRQNEGVKIVPVNKWQINVVRTMRKGRNFIMQVNFPHKKCRLHFFSLSSVLPPSFLKYCSVVHLSRGSIPRCAAGNEATRTASARAHTHLRFPHIRRRPTV